MILRDFKQLFFFFIFYFSFPGFLYAQESDRKFEGFNLQGYTDEGERSWIVHGDTANIVGTEVKLSNVDADVFGTQPMNITAEIGIIDQVSGKMHLEKDVVITSQQGARLLTDTLDWKRDEDTVATDDDVLITDKDFVASGTGMLAHPGLKNAQILKDVTVRVNIEPEAEVAQFVTITCDGPLEIDQAQSMAVFQNNVVAVQEDRTLKADRMELYYDQQTEQIREVICLGNVEITQNENKSFSEKAIYKGPEQKLILLGDPKLIMLTKGIDGTPTSGN